MKPLLLGLILSQGADLATALMVGPGCHEALWPNAKTAVSVKVPSISISVTLLPRLHREHPKVAKALAWSAIGSGVVGTVGNLKAIQGGCR